MPRDDFFWSTGKTAFMFVVVFTMGAFSQKVLEYCQPRLRCVAEDRRIKYHAMQLMEHIE